ncbi:Fpg/Nei family DNA glycosylase [Humibacter antri]
MPESPEVQAVVEQIGERLTGRALTAVDVLEFRVVKTRSRPPERLVGSVLADARRFGKYLDLVFGDQHLVASLGRHGWARWDVAVAPEQQVPPALAILGFGDGTRLELTDAGGWVSLAVWIVEDPLDVSAIAALGPDPADQGYSRADFDRAFAGRRKQLKAVLEEQKSIAGIGNAYSDEILFAARLNPVAHASALDQDELDRLFENTVGVMRGAIDARRGIPMSELKAAKTAAMQVHGRTGEQCPGCDGTIRDFAFASTTAQYCPRCQTGGELL